MKASALKSRTVIRSPYVAFAGVLLLLVATLLSRPAQAQTFSSSISGNVTDPSGAVVSGAKLKLENMSTHDVRLANSAADGAFTFANLLPGTYDLSTSAAGFRDFVKTNLILRANTAATVDVPLTMGSTEQRIVVNADAVLMDTETPDNSVTMDQALLENLPNNTRNPLNFVFDLAGTTEAQGGMTSRSQSYDQNSSMFGLDGGRTGEEEILVDGAPSTAIDWGGMMVSPMQDSVQEQQVVQNEYDAQYERGGEGVVTLVTKSGGNNFHGEFYDYMRNDGLDANYWSNDFSGFPKGKFHRNQFGANIGGPAWRKHNLYFFGAYEGLRQPETDSSGRITVPTDAEKKGDFSQTYLPNGKLDVIYNPFSTHLVTAPDGSSYYTRDPYPGNIITSGFDSVGQKLLSLYPSPNRPNLGPGPNDNGNFAAQGAGSTDNDKFDWRLDWAQSPNNRLFARMSDRVRENDTPACFFCNGADEAATNDDHGFQVVLNDTWTPSAHWVIDGYGAYTRWWEGQTSIGYGVADASKVGLSPSLFQAPLLPLVNAGGYYTLGSTYSSFDRYVRYLSTGIINMTRELHSHTLKFGANYDVGMINQRSDSPGTFNFDSGLTSCDPITDSAGNPLPCKAQLSTDQTGNSIASMLLGTGSGGSANINMDPAMSQHTFGLYLQDNWRVTRRLTIDAGLRYENQRPATERHNRAAYFDPSAVNPISTAFGSTLHGAFEYVGTGGRSRSLWEPDNLNFGPRLGAAYRITDKLVGRAGAAIFYGPTSAMLSFDDGGQSPGYTAQTNWISTQNSNGYIPTNLVSDPFPQGIQQPTGNSQGGLTYVGQGTSQLWVKGPHPVGEIYQWSMDFQYQATPHSVAEIGYTGTRGRRLLFGNPNFDLDQLPDKYLSLGSQLDELVHNPFYGVVTDPNSYLSGDMIARNFLLRPYPEYGWLIQTRSTPGARSQFDALTAKFNHSFSNGLSSVTTYQWSKALDDGSEALIGWTINDMWRDAYHPKLDYAISTRDVPQSFAEAWVYQLPYGHGRHFGGQSPQVLNQIVGGWNLSGAIRLASGYPFPNPVSFSYNNLNNYGFPGPGLPDIVGNPIPRNRSYKHWLNQSAFAGVSSDDYTTPLTCTAYDPSNPDAPSCQPFSYRYGNEPQRMSTIREAPTKNLDLGLGKQFGSERIHAELRGDFLNVFNHPIYGGSYNISNCLDCGDAGQVYGTRNDPRNIQVSLKITY